MVVAFKLGNSRLGAPAFVCEVRRFYPLSRMGLFYLELPFHQGTVELAGRERPFECFRPLPRVVIGRA